MKKTSLLLAVAALLSSSALSVLSVNAAETPAGNTSVAEFNVDAGKLTLNEVPDMLFNNVSFENLVKNNTTTLNYAAGTDAVKGNAESKSNQNSLDLTDYRGTDAGWTVNATMTAFSNGKSSLNGVLNYKGLGTISNTGSSKIVSGKEYTYSSTPSSEDTSLKVTPTDNQKKSGLTAGQYDADITWTLSDTAADATK